MDIASSILAVLVSKNSHTTPHLTHLWLCN
jgi:hypothetical protein